MDRVYKKALPALRVELEDLREGFASLDSRTKWARLRVKPLLTHVTRLERVIGSREFSRELSRLRRGVGMFRSDLDYLRMNVKHLQQILLVESKGQAVKRKNRSRRVRS